VLECTRKHGLKMNPNKCAFGVSAGQFLGFMVHQREIFFLKEAKPLLLRKHSIQSLKFEQPSKTNRTTGNTSYSATQRGKQKLNQPLDFNDISRAEHRGLEISNP
jgi:hypothetical protein